MLLAALSLLFTISLRAGQQTNPTRPRMPGKFVNVAGHQIHLYCTGQGSPAVIIAGGGFSVDWALVQPEVSKFTRVCTYDPTGMAWSEEVKDDPRPSCAARVKELHSLLTNAAIAGPYVLVGFSIGGLVARYYASEFPADVAGMVLVDHAFIDTGASPPPPAPSALSATGDSPPVLISTTLIALDIEDDRNFSKLPQRDQEAHRWALSISSARPTAEMASEYFGEIDAVEGSRSYPLGDKPLAVVSTLYDSPRYRELQRKLLTLSRNSHQLIAGNSTHMVTIDQPEIIVRAIQQVIKAAR